MAFPWCQELQQIFYKMIFNYLKVGLRNLNKYKLFSLINVFGLAAAMTICMLIILMLADQESYDQFNKGKDRIYRILSDKPDFRNPYATSPFPLSGTLQSENPMIESATHLVRGVGGDAVYKKHSVEMRGYFADSSFFKVFSFELKQGEIHSALKSPNSMIITTELAAELFGQEDPIGKTIAFSDRGLNFMGQGESSVPVSWGNYMITGVFTDKNYKSHLRFEVLVSTSSLPSLTLSKKISDLTGDWKDIYHCYTYVLLEPGKTRASLDSSLSRLAAIKYAGIPDYKEFKLRGQKLTDISPGILLGNEPNIILPRIVYYLLSLLAMVIMISACLNFTNLSIARALTRAKEIGIRKVNGALRKDLIIQFLSESILTTFFALAVAICLLFLVKTAFVHLWVNQYLHFSLETNAQVCLIFIGFALLIGLVAGIYPALYLSKFQPVKVLKNYEGIRPGKLGMQSILITTQFVISGIFIISSLLIFNQARHFLKFNYEFNPKNIVNIELQSNDYKLISSALSTVPGVSNISACDYIPITGRSEGISLKRAGSKEEYRNLIILQTDEYFVDNLELKLVSGKNLAAGKSSNRQVLVNESAVKEFGYPNPASIIGHSLVVKGNDTTMLQVIGVVQNFHMGLDRNIEPLILQNQQSSFKFLNVKLAFGDTRSTLAKLKEKWRTIDPVHPFKYQFFDEQLAATSQGFFDLVSILGFLAFLAITIACLGLLGMATYSTERRMKEVGIRKTLGAGDFGIIILLSSAFIRILGIAILIAMPLSYFLNNLWLRNFPNRVNFGFGTVFSGTVILLLLGLITIGSQTIRATRRNPADSLKMD